jgi:hypothetical protein
MGDNVDLQLVLKRVEDVLAAQEAIHAELTAVREGQNVLARLTAFSRRSVMRFSASCPPLRQSRPSQIF